MKLSDLIAQFITDQLTGQDAVELQRSQLASRFGCAPSQINYVIETRFSPARGFSVESRRGGGGYIRIVRVPMGPSLWPLWESRWINRELNCSCTICTRRASWGMSASAL